jgi:hypothetical protein
MPMQAQRAGGRASTNSQLGTRRKWGVRPLYPQVRPGTHCTGGWVGLGTGLDGKENIAPTGFDPRTVR